MRTNSLIPFAALVCAGLVCAGLPAQTAAPDFGHARTRELAELGILPTPLDVAVADIVNYHRHRLPLPRAGEAVAMDARFGGSTIHPDGEAFLQIGFATAATADSSALPPLNLALVVDCSGSMAAEGKLDEVKRALHAFAGRLRRDDRIALVAYSDEARLAASSRAFDDGRWFHRAVDDLQTGGATNLHGGLMLGLRECAAQLLPRGSNRVILLTDGIANRGETHVEAILRAASAFTAEDIDLSTIGVGRELNTALLDRLARGGRGLFHFVGDGKDIAKVFVDEADSLMAPAARRAQLRVQLPRELELLQVYGHEWRRDGDGIVLDLPDMNRGMTAIVLLRCRARGARAGDTLRVQVGFSAHSAVADTPIELKQQSSIHVYDPATDTYALTDSEVEKNVAIALLAQGMHDMAELAQDHRWAEAERVLRCAQDRVQELLPRAEDADFRAVQEMAAGHARTLRRYVDRFRDY